MSGNRFVCGMRRFDKHKTTTDRSAQDTPAAQESEKKLQEMIQLRNQQDNGIFKPLAHSTQNSAQVLHSMLQQMDK